MSDVLKMDLSEHDEKFFRVLDGEMERLLNVHTQNPATIWYPHTFAEDVYNASFSGEWSKHNPLPLGVTSSLYVNLLTEDNLPYYSQTILDKAPSRDHPFSEWGRVWTYEETRHSEIIRDFINASGVIDPFKMEDARRAQIVKGEVPHPESFAELAVYTALQEEATRIAHVRTGLALPKSHALGADIMKKVASDEARHKAYYEGLATAAFEVDPSTMVIAAAKIIRNFAMPGTGIVDFKDLSKLITDAGIYGPAQFSRIVSNAVNKWDALERSDISDDAKVAQELLRKRVSALARVATATASATAAPKQS